MHELQQGTASLRQLLPAASWLLGYGAAGGSSLRSKDAEGFMIWRSKEYLVLITNKRRIITTTGRHEVLNVRSI